MRWDEVVAAEMEGVPCAEGSVPLDRPLQEMFKGLYFPIPASFERCLVPRGDSEIRLQLNCDWFDVRTTCDWAPKEEEK